jgi:hypothetical protein
MDAVNVAAFSDSAPGQGPIGEVTLDPWLEPTVRLGSVGVWFVACALSVLLALQRARRTAPEPVAAAPAERGDAGWNSFCGWGFALALCGVLGGIREWRGGSWWGGQRCSC